MTPEVTLANPHAAGNTERDREVVVIGAGLAGLSCAHMLAGHGWRVRVIDKARGPGGRMATRRAEDLRFDHGAQYFTVRDERFADWVEAWRGQGLVVPWTGRIVVLDRGVVTDTDDSTQRFVGVPGMNTICQHLAAELQVSYGQSVERLERRGGRWHLWAEDGSELGSSDALVVTAPAPQSAKLLKDAAPDLAARAAEVEMEPCWAAMVAFDDPLELRFDGAFVQHSALSWIARDASKPCRPTLATWVLHGSPEWSRDELELTAEEVGRRLFAAFREAIGWWLPEPAHLVSHRWRYALPTEPLAETCLFDSEAKLAACGDWCGGPRIEGAFLSGHAAARRLLGLHEVDE